MSKNKQGKAYGSIGIENGKFAIVEGYKLARTNIVFTLSSGRSNCFAVTSWSTGEGKSTATTNLAISFSKMDKKVILIDADLRRPNVANLLNIEKRQGLTDYLSGLASYEDIIAADVLPNLDVITCGTIPPNPSELLGSEEMTRFVEKVKDSYDYVIFDTPPVGVVADALLLNQHILGFVAVVRENSTTHRDIENLVQNINLAHSKVIGFIKVGCSLQDEKYTKSGKYYRYGY